MGIYIALVYVTIIEKVSKAIGPRTNVLKLLVASDLNVEILPDIRSPKSLNSIIFELLITFTAPSLFKNHLQETETKNGVII